MLSSRSMSSSLGIWGLLGGLLQAVGCSTSSDAAPTSDNGAAGAGGSLIATPTTHNYFIDLLADPTKCLPRALAKNDAGVPLCQVVEAKLGGGCDCTADGRSVTPAAELQGVHLQLASIYPESCTSADGDACSNACACVIDQEEGRALAACQADPDAAATDPDVPPGYCYVDDPSAPTLASCPATQKQRLLFVSPNQTPTPAASAVVLLVCSGA